MSTQPTKSGTQLTNPAALSNRALAWLQQPTRHDKHDQQAAVTPWHDDPDQQQMPTAGSDPHAAPGAAATSRAPVNINTTTGLAHPATNQLTR